MCSSRTWTGHLSISIGEMDSMKNLEIYIHTPFCVKKCEYCDFLSFPADDATQLRYVKGLMAEMIFYGPLMRDYQVSTVYIGGGTPSWLNEEWTAALMEGIFECFNVAEDAEISIECNPGTLSRDKLLCYRDAGINRLSIGLQSANADELKLLGRIHTFEQFVTNYEVARNVGFKNINVDLMYGLPQQKKEHYLKTVNKITRLQPDHISAYSLIVEKGTPFYEKYKFDMVRQEAGMRTEFLPNEDELYDMEMAGREVLKEAGYRQYEISNYAKKGMECRHNIGYWTRENYLGLGIGAASLIENVRYTNTSDIDDYLSGCRNIHDVGEEIFKSNLHVSADVIYKKGQMEEFMFLGLRMNEGVTRENFEKAFGISVDAIYKDTMDSLKSQELLVAKGGHIYLSERGRDVANYVMAQFLMG